jgi:hypothetical protein
MPLVTKILPIASLELFFVTKNVFVEKYYILFIETLFERAFFELNMYIKVLQENFTKNSKAS